MEAADPSLGRSAAALCHHVRRTDYTALTPAFAATRSLALQGQATLLPAKAGRTPAARQGEEPARGLLPLAELNPFHQIQ